MQHHAASGVAVMHIGQVFGPNEGDTLSLPMAGTDVEQEENAFDEKVRSDADQRIGIVVGGKYRIVKTLGVGGMGSVYEAEHELIGKRVALKCLHPEYSRDRDLVERFKREARAATAIGNEHIVDVTDMGDLPDGAPFLVMEMLKGQALADLMDKEGVLPIGRSVKIVRQICFALAAAHEKGIVHRDMKPENVFLATRSESGDFVKVLDFGISKMHEHGKTDRGLTRTGIAMGTPSYMSPEQAQGAKDVDLRTDIWAVGVMLYEMLTLRRPFEADSYPMMLMAIVGRDPEPVRVHRKDVPEALERAILKTLVKPVGLRTQTMRELADDLLPFVGIDGAAEMTGIEPRNSLVAQKPRDSMGSAAGGTRVGSSDGSVPSLLLDAEGEPMVTANTIAAGSSAPPPPREGGRQATPMTRAGERPPNEDAREARDPANTGVLGTTERKNQPTSEMGVVERRGREATSSGTAVPMRGGSGMYIALAAVGVVLLSVGAYAMSGGTPPSATTPEATTSEGAGASAGTGVTSGTGAGTTGAGTTGAGATGPEVVSVPVAPLPTEVAVQITTSPADARIEIEGVEFPNPMSAHRPRSLDPVTIRISAEGYETVERLAIFDHEQSFMFQLSRGRGVRREGTDGRVHAAGTAAGTGTGGAATSEPPRETPRETPPDPAFRDEF
jgi:serine/threonine protein kinase